MSSTSSGGNTVAVSGVSQSSTASSMVMPELEKDGVPADAVKFFLVGDPSTMAQVTTAINNLGPATQQGAAAFASDLSHPATPDVASLSGELTEPAAGGGASAADLSSAFSGPTDIVNGLTGAFAQAYALLLPTADILTALAVSMPTYDTSLFVENITNPLNAVGLPIADDVALLTLAAGIEYMTINHAVSTITSELSGAFGF